MIHEMTESEVVALMGSSKTEKEWNDNCDIVKEAFGDYPSFWWEAIMMSGLANRVMQSWPSYAAKTPGEVKIVGNMAVLELLPPTPEEIEEIRKNQK